MSQDLIRLMSALFLQRADTYQVAPWQPNVDVYRNAVGWLVKFEVAGVRADDLDLEVLGGRLTLRGVRRDTTHEDALKNAEPSCVHHRMEISYGPFERSIELPCNLKKAQLRTQYRDGLLLIFITPDQS